MENIKVVNSLDNLKTKFENVSSNLNEFANTEDDKLSKIVRMI